MDSFRRQIWVMSRKSVKLAWSLGFDLLRVRRVARYKIRVGVGLGSGYGLV